MLRRVQVDRSELLNSREIRRLIEEKQLITGYVDLNTQLQPTGFDLSLGTILDYKGKGSVDFSNVEREIAPSEPLEPDDQDWYTLEQGCYTIVYNEVVKIPLDVVAMARSRSTSRGTPEWSNSSSSTSRRFRTATTASTSERG
jgi:dUTP pyrophosphatase